MSRALANLPQEVAFASSRLMVRSARSMKTQIPVGAKPQILVSAIAPHRNGASKDIARLIFEHGASVAATKKIMVEGHFAMLLSVWTPGEQKAALNLAEKLRSAETASRMGFVVQASMLEPARADVEEAGVLRRLKLTCPQRPGLILAITELLKDHACKMSAINADTMAKGCEIWFEIEAVIDVPHSVDPSTLEGALRFWTQSKESRATLIFDNFVSGTQPLSHA